MLQAFLESVVYEFGKNLLIVLLLAGAGAVYALLTRKKPEAQPGPATEPPPEAAQPPKPRGRLSMRQWVGGCLILLAFLLSFRGITPLSCILGLVGLLVVMVPALVVDPG